MKSVASTDEGFVVDVRESFQIRFANKRGRNGRRGDIKIHDSARV